MALARRWSLRWNLYWLIFRTTWHLIFLKHLIIGYDDVHYFIAFTCFLATRFRQFNTNVFSRIDLFIPFSRLCFILVLLQYFCWNFLRRINWMIQWTKSIIFLLFMIYNRRLILLIIGRYMLFQKWVIWNRGSLLFFDILFVLMTWIRIFLIIWASIWRIIRSKLISFSVLSRLRRRILQIRIIYIFRTVSLVIEIIDFQDISYFLSFSI